MALIKHLPIYFNSCDRVGTRLRPPKIKNDKNFNNMHIFELAVGIFQFVLIIIQNINTNDCSEVKTKYMVYFLNDKFGNK